MLNGSVQMVIYFPYLTIFAILLILRSFLAVELNLVLNPNPNPKRPCYETDAMYLRLDFRLFGSIRCHLNLTNTSWISSHIIMFQCAFVRSCWTPSTNDNKWVGFQTMKILTLRTPNRVGKAFGITLMSYTKNHHSSIISSIRRNTLTKLVFAGFVLICYVV